MPLFCEFAVVRVTPIVDPVVLLLLTESELVSERSSGGRGGLKFGGGGRKTLLCPLSEFTDTFIRGCFGGIAGGTTLLPGPAASGMVGKSRPSMRNGNLTMTGCPEVPMTNLPANRSNASARASCAAHAVARQARPARHLGEAGRGVGIAGGQCGSLIAGNGW